MKVLQYLAHAEGICLSGGGKYRTYGKGVLRALFWLVRISQIHQLLPKTLQHKMPIGM